jgi:penicillin-binding protein 2
LSDSPYGEPRSGSRRFLPPDPNVQEPFRLTPRLALRVGVMGAIALALFAVLFFRLWSLQVLSGERYLEAAQSNQLRTVRLEAPRGPIVDRRGRVIVANTPGTAVKLWVADMPRQGRYRMIQRLAAVLDLPPRELARRADEGAADPLNPITVKTAVGDDQVMYLYEHQSEFPGVAIEQTYLRQYPYKALAAQLLGSVGEISAEELKRKRAEGYVLGDRIGKSGVEGAYDTYLRGEAGVAQIRVDSRGRPQSRLEVRRDARAGYAVRLTIDAELQRAAERALVYGIETAKANESYFADGGAIVALDPRDGAVLAMASYPTFKPSVWVGRIDPKKVAPLLDDEAAKKVNYPGVNRATSGLYPPGSTWKPVTALAAMQEHMLAPYDSIQCTPTATYGLDEQEFRNWNPYVNKPMTLSVALAESCDTYFYEVGNRFYQRGLGERSYWTRMQEWASQLGFGQATGLDVGGEATGLLPTPEWRRKTYTSDWDRAWNPGDLIQYSIGQKDLTVTPLQMARFYALLANGGRLVTPHVVAAVEQPGGDGQGPVVLRSFAAEPPRSAGLDPAALQVVNEGLYLATHAQEGTSSAVFADFPVPIAGKTGTAEKVVPLPGYPPDHLEDQSWWCGWGPYGEASYNDRPPLVVCALIENGGHGSTAAAPAALRLFETWFGVEAPEQQILVATD